MDLDEWELLPVDGYIDFNEESEKKMYLGRTGSVPRGIFNMDHFRCPSPNSWKQVNQKGDTHIPAQLVNPVPVNQNKNMDLPPVITETNKAQTPNIEAEADQDVVSQVFFKRSEFVDMKMDSSPNSGGFLFDDKGEVLESCFSPRKLEEEIFIKKNNMVLDHDVKEDVSWEENKDKDSGINNNIWKWSLSGIGALCSFGFAAATFCILILGSHQRNKKNQQNQNFKFQMYTDDKRMKQVVHHASKLNEAISAARGVPLTRAHITFGGYYDGL